MKTEIRYGIIFALIVVVYVMIEHFLGFNTTRHDIGQYTRLAGVLVPILGIFFGIRAKRQELNGRMIFGQGVKTGFLIAVIQTTITTLWFWFYGTVVNPQFMDTMLEFERAKMAAAGTDANTIATGIARMKSLYSTPTLQIFQEVLGIVYGTVFALIFSFFLRTRREPSTM
jgi:hypothetical protein